MNAVLQAMQNLGGMRVIAISVVGVVLLATFTFLFTRLSAPVYTPLYTNLTTDDSALIVKELSAMSIPFDVAQGGEQVSVKGEDVLKIRMALAQKGLPRQGSIVGYEIFDKEAALGTSNFVLNVNLMRALEGELGRTVSALDGVKSARVHLVLPKRDLFRRTDVEPSASVTLTLSSGKQISKEEVAAVRHMVGAAVPGLKPSRVNVVDSTGKVLARGASDDDDQNMAMQASDADDYRNTLERKMERTVENILEGVVGAEKVRTQITADVNFDRINSNEEKFDPESQVARSVQTTEEKSANQESNGGNVSVGNNLPDANGQGAKGGNQSSSNRTDEVTNFEISRTVTNKINEVGRIRKLSVAVLVDGRYQLDAATGKETYIPRTEEELAKLETLVKTAIGFDADRGDTVEIVNMQFDTSGREVQTPEGALDWIKSDFDSILRTVVVGVVAILAILLVIRPLVNRAFELSSDIVEDGNITAANALDSLTSRDGFAFSADGGMEEVTADSVQNRRETTPVSRVNEIMDNNPEESLAAIRIWMTQK